MLNEITASLDPEIVREDLDVVVGLARDGVTMVVVTHEMAFARAVADRIAFMDAGRIVEIAPPEEFFAAPKSERAQRFLDQLVFKGSGRLVSIAAVGDASVQVLRCLPGIDAPPSRIRYSNTFVVLHAVRPLP